MTELKPGRELDALVAYQVLGWSRSDFEINTEISHFSTDLAAAWGMGEAAARKTSAKFWVVYRPDMPEKYEASLFGMQSHKAYAETAALAICLACLKAVGANS